MHLQRLGFYCGIVSPILWLALIATAGALRPDFRYATNYISELAERGSVTEALMRYGGFGFTGLLYVCFAGALLATFRNGWLQITAALLIALDGVGRMGAGVFSCDPGCVHVSPGPDLHKLFATIGFCSGVLATFLWGRASRDIPRLRSIASVSAGSGAVAFASLLLLTWAGDLGLPAGLFEHVATVALSVWMLVFAGKVAAEGNIALR